MADADERGCELGGGGTGCAPNGIVGAASTEAAAGSPPPGGELVKTGPMAGTGERRTLLEEKSRPLSNGEEESGTAKGEDDRGTANGPLSVGLPTCELRREPGREVVRGAAPGGSGTLLGCGLTKGDELVDVVVGSPSAGERPRIGG
jgi:hypothetical protein